LVPSLLTVLIFLTDTIISGYEITPSGVINPMFGPGGTIYNILVSAAPLLGAVLIFWNYRKVDPLEKTRYVYLIIGLILSVGVALVTNVFLTDYIEHSSRYEFYSRLGIFSSIFIALLPGYAIIKHRLFNIKIIATEVFSFAILLVMFVQIFLSENWYQLVARVVIFIIVFFLVAMLVKSVDNEIKRKDELQQLSDRLAVANAELHRLDNAKSEFISIASHQLRTPLTAIKGFVSLLLEGAYGRVEPAVADTLNKVYIANARLMSLVENLLNISRIEAGRIQYQFAPTKVEDVLSELRDLFVLAAHEKGLKLKLVLPKEPLPILSLDGPKIREAVSNVIDNAIKYTEKGDIAVTAEKKADHVVITVADTGVGIDPAEIPHLFKKFERGKNAVQVNVSSTGLGLYVGKSFIEAHGGTIRVESAGQGKGSRFIMELPIDRKPLEKKPEH
jgi:signal transduction histidine kinase